MSYGLYWSPVTEKIRPTIAHNIPNRGIYLESVGTAPLNSATHVAMTFDGTTLRLYLNGQLDIEEATTACPRAPSASCRSPIPTT